MNVYMRRLGVAGLLIFWVSYPAISARNLAFSNHDWRFKGLRMEPVNLPVVYEMVQSVGTVPSIT
jgi:hypothetical protein